MKSCTIGLVLVLLASSCCAATQKPESTVQAVSYCDLVKAPQQFAGKRIRVRAIYADHHPAWVPKNCETSNAAPPKQAFSSCIDLRYSISRFIIRPTAPWPLARMLHASGSPKNSIVQLLMPRHIASWLLNIIFSCTAYGCICHWHCRGRLI
jgi:hypothetical protein